MSVYHYADDSGLQLYMYLDDIISPEASCGQRMYFGQKYPKNIDSISF